METQDLRHLLKTDKLPVYNSLKLVPVWESILFEYEKLTGSLSYTASLRKLNFSLSKSNRLNGLIACYYLVKYNSSEAEESLKYWKINNSTLENIKTLILSEQTRLNIDTIRNAPKEKRDIDFDKMVAMVEDSRGRDFRNIDKITVKKWVTICQLIDSKAKQTEELKSKIKDGRR